MVRTEDFTLVPARCDRQTAENMSLRFQYLIACLKNVPATQTISWATVQLHALTRKKKLFVVVTDWFTHRIANSKC